MSSSAYVNVDIQSSALVAKKSRGNFRESLSYSKSYYTSHSTYFKLILEIDPVTFLAYCRTGDAKPNTAVSEGGIVVCMPGFVFADGQTYHSITCDRPPTWNWGSVPACVPVRFSFTVVHKMATFSKIGEHFQINEVVAWKCPVQTTEAELAGEISVFQPDPRSPVFIQGFSRLRIYIFVIIWYIYFLFQEY